MDVHAPEAAAELAEAVMTRGGSLESFAAAIGVSASSVREWLQSTCVCTACFTFRRSFYAGEADWRNTLLGNIARAANAQDAEPRWSAWLLERTRPQEFGAQGVPNAPPPPPPDATTLQKVEWQARMATLAGDHKTALAAMELAARLRGELIDRSESMSITGQIPSREDTERRVLELVAKVSNTKLLKGE